MSLSELLSEIREQTGASNWSKGVELSRRDAVHGDKEEDGEIGVRVLDRGLGRAILVQLWPEDIDWNSDCSCEHDPCHHVAAAAIALNQAKQQGKALPQSKTASGKISYHFTSTDQGLALKRMIKDETSEVPLTSPLTTSRGTKADMELSPCKEDLAIDIALDRSLGGILKDFVFEKIAPHLRNLDHVFLDETPVKISTELVGLVAELKDHGTGVEIKGGLDPRIEKTYKNSVALILGHLHPVQQFKLSPGEYKTIKNGRIFHQHELISLASEILPALQEKLSIKNLSKNLPKANFDKPRLEMELKTIGPRLQATPYIVYGCPIYARIGKDDLEQIGEQVPIRNLDMERKLRDQLQRDLSLDPGQARYYHGEEGVKYIQSLGRWRGDLRGKGQYDFALHNDLVPQVKLEGSQLQVQFESHEDGRKEAQSSAVFEAWQKGQSLVPLKGGGWAPLPMDWLNKYGKKVLELLMAKGERNEVPKASIPSLVQLSQDLGQKPSQELVDFKNRLENFSSIPAADTPSIFNAKLRLYQQEGVNWLSYLKSNQLGALLADDMGLGKTLQSISILEGPSLVIAPTSVIPNWKKEIQRFRPNLKVNIYHGPQRSLRGDYDILISSYGLLRMDIEELKARHFKVLVLDEAQWIKNPDSKVTRAAYELNADFRLALSGTPVENSLEDLWSQFQFLNPGLLGQRQYFKDQYIKPILDNVPGAAASLQQKIKPFLLRRLKKEVAKELPPKTEKILYAELSEEERNLYASIMAASQKEVIEKVQQGASVFEALEALLRMRQACCHPSLIPGQQAFGSAKLDLLMKSLGTAIAEGHKALVFSQWTSFLDLMEPEFDKKGISYLRLDGSTRDRAGVVDSFQSSDGPSVLIMSLKAGGVGLNLSRADHVFIMDPWWNPAVEDQAADRAHRIGQENPVMVHPIVALDTVEEKILQLQAKKRELADAAIGSGKGALNLSKEDILSLLED